jgi:hypothetical protein
LTEKSSTVCFDSGSQLLALSRTITRSPSICTRTADSGRSVGNWLASACSAFVMRRAGTFASMSPFAVRSSTRS